MMPFVGPPEPETPLQAHYARQAAEEERARNIGIGWKVGPTAASLFDAWATQDALKRGGVEANPVMAPFADNPAAMYAVKAGSGALVGLLAHRLARDGHPNAARLLSGIGIAVPLGAGAWNLAGGR